MVSRYPFRLPKRRLLVLTLGGLSLPAPSVSGQAPAPPPPECALGSVTQIRIRNASVMEEERIRDRPLAWAWRLVNRLHFRTRERFIRDDLLFREGDCYDPALLADSERTLRNYPFIAFASVQGKPSGDGAWEVQVETRDEWSTWPNLHIALDGRFLFQGFSLREGNLLGRGITSTLFYSRVDQSRNRGVFFRFPRLFRSRLDGIFSAGKTRIGEFFTLQAAYPFLGEVGRFAASQRLSYQDSYRRFSTGTRKGISHILLPVEDRRADLTLARRWGEPGSLTELGISLFWAATIPSPRIQDARIAYNDSFDDLTPVPDSLFQSVVSQTAEVHSTVVGAMLGRREIRFVPRRGLDLVEGIQDVAIGREAGLFLGVGLAGEGTRASASGDLLLGGHLFAGASGTPGVVNVRGLVEGRRARVREGLSRPWRDLRAEGEATGYWTPGPWPGSLFGRVYFQGAWRVDRPYQSTLGGVGRLRGYFEEELPVGAGLVGTLEVRADLPWPRMVDLGVTAFLDAGRGWDAGVPFGQDTGWLSSVGGGVRLAFPSGSATLLRIEGGWPVRQTMRLDDLLIRAYFVDLKGLLGLRSDGTGRRFNGYLNRLRGY